VHLKAHGDDLDDVGLVVNDQDLHDSLLPWQRKAKVAPCPSWLLTQNPPAVQLDVLADEVQSRPSPAKPGRWPRRRTCRIHGPGPSWRCPPVVGDAHLHGVGRLGQADLDLPSLGGELDGVDRMLVSTSRCAAGQPLPAEYHLRVVACGLGQVEAAHWCLRSDRGRRASDDVLTRGRRSVGWRARVTCLPPGG